MMKKLFSKLSFLNCLYFLGFITWIVGGLFILGQSLGFIPKYEKDFINEKYHYKIVKQPGFHLSEGQPMEDIVLNRVLTRRRRSYLWCKDIYYGVEIHSWCKDEEPLPESDDEKIYYSNALIDNCKELIVEVRGKKIVDIKPNHKGIETSLIIKNPDTGKPTYYYDTRIWAYGNMYVIHLNACIETTNTKEYRAERDKDYSYTYKQIIDSLQIDENIKALESK